MANIPGSPQADIISPTGTNVYLGGAGDDTYIISQFGTPADMIARIVDTEDANRIQLNDGLTIASSSFTNNAVSLTLSNGAVIQILGADNMTFEIGANATIGNTAPSLDYATFAAQLGVAALPAAGEPPAAGTPDFVVGDEPDAPTFSLTAAADAVAEGEEASWTLDLAAADATEEYAVSLTQTFVPTATLEDVGDLAVTGEGVTFDAATGLITFAAGTTTATVTQLFVTDEVTPEDGEAVTLTLSAPTNGAAVSATAGTSTVAITDVPPEGNVIQLSDVQPAVTAVDGTAEIFVLDFTSGTAAAPATSADAVVTITGFNPAEDILRFDDSVTPALSAANFLDVSTGGALVVADQFTRETTISFFDPDDTDAIAAAQITLVGIVDATLGGADAFYQVV